MSRAARVAAIRPQVFNVSDKTNGFFVAVEADDGSLAWGEASLNGREPALEAATRWGEAQPVPVGTEPPVSL